jgi:hypothetical protein
MKNLMILLAMATFGVVAYGDGAGPIAQWRHRDYL